MIDDLVTYINHANDKTSDGHVSIKLKHWDTYFKQIDNITLLFFKNYNKLIHVWVWLWYG